ncbi:MAG: undecaprenyl-diphosphate phosphatase [Ruminococcaceae bacterium]|nr:undecaprenyl-diphosphate phosphatase [Oscillospiraceae bacterium]
MDFIELLKAVLFGIVEGITEWLPVSSTGHIILLDEFIHLNVSEDFKEMFDVVIQLGAILAVIVLFFRKLNPFDGKKTKVQKADTWQLWFKVIVAVLPSAVLGLAFEEQLDTYLYNYVVVAAALVIYGVAFLFLERGDKTPAIREVHAIDYKTAIFIGCFQCLSLIPGTSRSGSTILGAILLGVSRSAGAEFSFFLAIPTMLGASALKLLGYLKDGASATATELGVLAVGCVVSFVVSLLVIRGLMNFVRNHSFRSFGIYRIVLGVLVLAWFILGN